MKKQEYNYIAGFPERLDQLMYDNDVNAIQLGKVVGRERKTIYDWRNCTNVPDAVRLMKLCVFFSVSADWLLFGDRE